MKPPAAHLFTFFTCLSLLASVIGNAGQFTPAHAAGTVLYASPGGLTSGACDTWANACELSYALSQSISGDEIWTAAGIYKPSTDTDRTATFQLQDDVAVYGGFAGAETLRTERNPAINTTILSGDIGAVDDTSDNAYHVVTGADHATLDGFTITAGNANGADDAAKGGGMYDYRSNLTLTNVTFNNNTASNGGGMYSDSSNLTLTNVTYSNNSADSGGGLYGYRGNLTLTNMTFSNNSADSGGGMYKDSGDPTLTNVTFSNNSADSGGGLYDYRGNLTLANVTFSNNSADNGSGMYDHSGSPILKNVTFSNNSANNNGGGLYNDRGIPTIRNTIFWANISPNTAQIYSSNTLDISDSVVQGGYAGGKNIISADPLLGVSGNYGGSTTTIPLLPGSSAINTGNTTYCTAGSDQRGMSYLDACDIGAFESQGFTLTKTGGDNQSAALHTTFADPLTLNVTPNNAAEPVDGGKLKFTAPGSGASANPVASTTTISGGAVSQSLSAKGTSGSYTVIASTAGAVSVNFSLSNIGQLSAITEPVTSVTIDSATLNGTVNANNDNTTTTFEYGLDTSYGTTVTADQSPVTGAIDMPVSVTISGLMSQTIYHYRVVAVNSSGTTYGSDQIFTSEPYYVNENGTGDCSTWANACSLQTALNNVISGYEIWVAAGTYKPTSGTDRTATFQLKEGVAVYGGFTGAETLRTQRNPAVNTTILSGNIGAVDDTKDNVYHVVTGANNATLDGFTVTAGNANGVEEAANGGGMYNDGSSPTLTNVIFSNNSAKNPSFGGYGGLGGGMYNYGSSPTLINVTFSKNSAKNEGSGGGMYNYGSSPTLTNVTFSNNSADDGNGGGMYNYSSSPTLTNTTFSDNFSIINPGSGMYNDGNSSPTIRNAIFWDNTGFTTVQIYNRDSTPNVSDSIVQGGYAGGTNIITADPLLGALGNYGGFTTTIPLLPSSSAINTGNLTYCTTGSDQRGMSYVDACDMGAFESQGFTITKTDGDHQSTAIHTAFASSLTLNVIPNNPVEPVDWGIVKFTAPGSGASINPAVSTATIFGNMVSQNVTANSISGSYTVIASAAGATSVNFSLSNLYHLTAITRPATTITASGATLKGLINARKSSIITFEYGLDTHYGTTVTANQSPVTGGIDTVVSKAITSLKSTTIYHYRVVANSGTEKVYGNDQTFETSGTLYVKPNGNGDCFSWQKACSLQTALSKAHQDYQIWVMAGTYKPTSSTDRTTTFQLKEGVAIYGGFAGTETLRTQRNLAVNTTILSGDIGTVNNASDNTYHVVIGTNNTTLDGFTITGGNANGADEATNGGGMYNYASSPTLTNIIFSGNSTINNQSFGDGGYGGGMFNYASSPTLTNVTFSGNSAINNQSFGGGDGGGMYNYSSNPTLTNVTFSGNSAISNQTFGGGGDGGGMYNYDSSPTLTNVTFSGNSAINQTNDSGRNGGGMYNLSNSSPTIYNTIFWGNTASTAAQIFNDSSSTPNVSYSVVQGGYAGGTNIITANPRLGKLGNYGGFTQVIPLQSQSGYFSSAVDAGQDNVCPSTDQRGTKRPQVKHCDIGAYEYMDTFVPETTLILKPSTISIATVTFTFSTKDDLPGVTLTCQLDGNKKNCSSGTITYSGLSSGPHLFQVQACDTSKHCDPSPVKYAWYVNAVGKTNLLKNGSFETKPDATNWQGKNLNTTIDTLTSQKIYDGLSAWQFGPAKTGIQKILYQNISRSGNTGEKFTLEFYNAAQNVPVDAALYQVVVTFYKNGKALSATKILKCSPGTHGWEFKTLSFSAPAAYDSIQVSLVFSKTTGRVWFDKVRLWWIP